MRRRYSKSRLTSALVAGGTCGAQDHTHAFRNLKLLGDGFQALAVAGIGDLAGNAAAARRIRHQHGIAAGEREIGGSAPRLYCRALSLTTWDEKNLAALDDLLDLILPARAVAADRHFLHGVAAQLLDVLGFFIRFVGPRCHYPLRLAPTGDAPQALRPQPRPENRARPVPRSPRFPPRTTHKRMLLRNSYQTVASAIASRGSTSRLPRCSCSAASLSVKGSSGTPPRS